MGNAIHITRRNLSGQNLPIALSEWRAVVERTSGVRMANGGFQVTNSTTAEVVKIRNLGGDVEAFSRPILRGGVCFTGRLPAISRSGHLAILSSPLRLFRRLAAALARDLIASLIGDEGGIYD